VFWVTLAVLGVGSTDLLGRRRRRTAVTGAGSPFAARDEAVPAMA
jgi:hypothetical protein